MSAEKLYTPAMLAAAVQLADYPPIAGASLHGEARSATCGSEIVLDAETDADGAISAVGLKVRACAVGQAAASLFAQHAQGRGLADIERTHTDLTRWLKDGVAMPEWPSLSLIAAARDYPARHDAMLLPWKAAIAALSSAPASS
ncbi:iron-sulfur cluster assembly scaffold protein [Aurantiacibacter sp. MUD61]|uniref:iron-sulfur cluster assembly scaffold protein n=1 Tax=Aurantiacibacter sp. MUD61 TaxID=3009083 RepID=UPI0022F13541|nr:iron-sulfur cluster assembly scaffold protein [Aurantiacibacter sp. MUD61]